MSAHIQVEDAGILSKSCFSFQNLIFLNVGIWGSYWQSIYGRLQVNSTQILPDNAFVQYILETDQTQIPPSETKSIIRTERRPWKGRSVVVIWPSWDIPIRKEQRSKAFCSNPALTGPHMQSRWVPKHCRADTSHLNLFCTMRVSRLSAHSD